MEMNRNKRIFISGISGAGKTTLAQYISHRYRIPFINGSSKVLWEEEGIDSHAEIIKKSVMDPVWGLDFQYKLLKYREEQISKHEQFVTDRSPVDNLVYTLLQLSPYLGNDVMERYKNTCDELLGFGNQLIYLDVLETPDFRLEDDGMRVGNMHYQAIVNTMFRKVITEKYLTNIGALDLKPINTWRWEDRVKEVESMFNVQKPSTWSNLKEKFYL